MFGDDGRGCPADSDNDGVYDGQDLCPGTADGIIVDETGCEVDGDGDGVVDSEDDCPDTAANVTVEENGCVLDVGPIDEDDDQSNQSGDDGDDTNTGSDGTESGISNQAYIFGGIGLLVVVLILGGVLVFRGGKGASSQQDAFVNAAFDQGLGQPQGEISAEQTAYEQQMIAMGYTPEQARQYADPHFRPWLYQ